MRLPLVLALTLPLIAADRVTIQSNVAYGVYSGAALPLDVCQPDSPKGYCIIQVSGSG